VDLVSSPGESRLHGSGESLAVVKQPLDYLFIYYECWKLEGLDFSTRGLKKVNLWWIDCIKMNCRLAIFTIDDCWKHLNKKLTLKKILKKP